jgi:hypothetical protein
MKFTHILKIFTLALLLVLPLSMATAADRSVFKNKSEKQHELTSKEDKKIVAEFKSQFSGVKPGAFQKRNNNPWAAKKSRQQHRADKFLKMASTWGSCREYAYKQRGQCYARGNDSYTCERFYDARAKRCDNRF